MKAFIFGISGQIGSYLAELLLSKGYAVAGSAQTAARAARHLGAASDQISFHFPNVLDYDQVLDVLSAERPDEIYYLAGPSFVPGCTEGAESAADALGSGLMRALTAARDLKLRGAFVHASSAQIFGHTLTRPATEKTPLLPSNAYGAAKAMAHQMVINFRRTYKMRASNAILFNCESPRRDPVFLTRKAVRAAYSSQKTAFGNLKPVRDFLHAQDAAEAMWRMAQSGPADLIVATGEGTPVEKILSLAFAVHRRDWREWVMEDQSLMRHDDPPFLVGWPAALQAALKWAPPRRAEAIMGEMASYF